MLKWSAYALFYGYVGLLVLAGSWGIFFARVDQEVLLRLDVATLPTPTQANVLSQYRFLRATELGFGAYALVYRRAILTGSSTALFLCIMAAGVLARLVSIVVDGSPDPWFYFFLVTELAGVVLIYAHVQRARRQIP